MNFGLNILLVAKQSTGPQLVRGVLMTNGSQEASFSPLIGQSLKMVGN